MKTLPEHSKENENKWDKRAKTYDHKRYDYFRLMQKKAIARIGIKENISFLDLGCGTGWAVKYVSTLAKGNGEFWGIDISNGMIEKAKENTKDSEVVKFRCANAEELPFNNDYFDAVLCTNSFHHYLNPSTVLDEIFRILKLNGRFYLLDVTNDDFFVSRINHLLQKKEKAHVSFYSSAEYKAMFTKSGLKYNQNKKLTYPLKLHIVEKC